MERRHGERIPAPAGAATEAAIAHTLEADGTLAPEIAFGAAEDEERGPASLAMLALAAAGVVFGDIGTNPLFVLRAAFYGRAGLAPSAPNVLGVLSLIVWSLLLVVTVKYVAVVMRADNRGEGGVLALLTLLLPDLEGRRSRRAGLWIGAGLAGAALLYGDGAITPAISVLSAIEGLQVATPRLAHLVVPLTAIVLVLLFAVQHRGTARIGRVFGPVMLVWFATLGLLGARSIAATPDVLSALSPAPAIAFFAMHHLGGILVLGAVILSVAGAEALYADMGHFGRKPIALVWMAYVLPCLVLNYLGQGALLLRRPGAAHPFFELAPASLLLPLVALATLATVIASQSLISGAFSLARQLMHLGYSPLVTVTHTSHEREGQIYVPQVNWLLMLAALLLVLGFRTSDHLAASYGLAVSGTMALTTLLFALVARWIWRWPLAAVALVAGTFLVADVAFLVANLAKIPYGGWVPLALAAIVYAVFSTWRAGRERLLAVREASRISIETLLRTIAERRPCRTHGTGMFLTPIADEGAGILHRYIEQVGALPERVLLLTVVATGTARVPQAERLRVERVAPGLARVTARYGYMQSVRLREVIAACGAAGLCDSVERTTFYVARERVWSTGRAEMPRWQKAFFVFIQRNAPSMQDFFDLPPRQVVELGQLVEL